MTNTPILNRLFGRPEEMNGGGRCPTTLYRWHLLSTRWFKAYLHKFVHDEWSLDLHDHPKRFISIGLWGKYVEWTPGGRGQKPTVHRAPWIRSFPAEHQHRITVPYGPCWTIAITLKTVREWGWWHKGRFIDWKTYVRSKEGDERSICQ
jgi:hypothetical protein